jgi:hypothetical protein
LILLGQAYVFAEEAIMLATLSEAVRLMRFTKPVSFTYVDILITSDVFEAF